VQPVASAAINPDKHAILQFFIFIILLFSWALNAPLLPELKWPGGVADAMGCSPYGGRGPFSPLCNQDKRQRSNARPYEI
jgi:hypothetical protein